MGNTDPYQSGTEQTAYANEGYAYKYFLPSYAPRTVQITSPKLSRLLEEATHMLGELNAYARFVPDIDFFIRMHEIKEATASSRIEGTKTNLDEALMDAEDIMPERRDDWQEVQNYIQAMNHAVNRLEKLPVSKRLLNETHEILLSGVRGEEKQPGAIRESQNWIGGATLKDARFIPPAHQDLPDLLTDLEEFLHEDDLNMSLLVKAGIAHYQFETIHPYLDGNGRIGRLLIILYLIEQKLLDRPILYLSQFFDRYKQEYYEALDTVRAQNDLEQWLRFFLVGITETSRQAIHTLQSIQSLQETHRQEILKLGRRSENASALLERLYTDPIISVSEAAEELDVTPPTANSLVKELHKLGMLKEITGFSRNRIFIYEPYIRLFTDYVVEDNRNGREN
ncbi:cell filamentation protein Fic [Candidatus Saccharibacteria bacterium QS_5_54_17]|nr:MAG: cell filamentation protein Fic [Candidatus Saccharibacteria bacterium QS_5_54_17]